MVRPSQFPFCFLPLFLFFHFSIAATSSVSEPDRLALLAFKSEISTDPSSSLVSWNESVPLCEWTGITCNKDERVTSVVLELMNLEGTLSPSLSNLTQLTTLRLSGNEFTGQIPTSIGNLSYLNVLNLSSNGLVGTIPVELYNLSNLTFLNLSYNSFTGSISPLFINFRNLTYLSLSSNNLTGEIPAQLGDLKSLTSLKLSNNQLDSVIPPSLGNLSQLKTLDLSANYLHGELPTDLGRMSNLSFFKVSNNELGGAIPLSIYNITSLTSLVVNNNFFSGELPANIGNTLPNLVAIAMFNNQITGSIPVSLANASGLTQIDLSTNQFSGKIPSNLGMLENLSWLALESNQLEATEASDWDFLKSLANCNFLNTLNLNSNNLTGSLPSSIGNLSTQLSYLNLMNNQISGEIPPTIANLVNLNTLLLSRNKFSGVIPNSFGQLLKLEALDLFNNQLSGEIPSWIGNMTRLNELLLSNNQLQGKIPTSIGNCQNLNEVDFSHNRLSGSIPKELLSLSSISQWLGLSYNLLSGPLPPEIGRLQSLSGLDISNNNLSGRIPDGIGDCLVLEYLNMSNNNFNGSIPTLLKELRGLKELDLSQNDLSGPFPSYLAEFRYLERVNLSFNDLSGQVPTEGIFANSTAVSVLGNSQACGGIPNLDLPACPTDTPKKNKHLIVKILVPLFCGILFLLLLVCLYIAYMSKRNSGRKQLSFKTPLDNQSLHVSHADLVKATDDFSFENLLGSGAFGAVFKGILKSGELVAVKVLNLQQQGAFKSFVAECEALRNIRHRNLIKILTACSSVDATGNEFKALVFEFMPNGNLDMWVHSRGDQENGSKNRLSLVERLSIAIDVAAALNYLHNHCETPIIHCDLKPSNVLLDENMTAHVGDFGLARFLQKISGKDYKDIFTSTALKGSIGYVPPEYGMSNNISMQGDVYSFGILLLELFTGKRPTNNMFKDGLTLHKFVENEISKGTPATQIVDASLFPKDVTYATDVLESGLCMILKVGLSCSKVRQGERSKIKDVVTQLAEVKEYFLL
ncbi:hypothetical protein LUZ60_015235 [Juncus effusus]|nr:hypothetical protein LUZ60_015235 [Juncus effusus]